MGRHVLFRCPNTGYRVQHWLDDSEDNGEDKFVSVECPACTRFHFINRESGKTLGEQ